MSSKWIIVSGDQEVVKMLNSLGRKTAGVLHRTASRKAAKLVLDHARSTVPKRTGAFAKSLTIRSITKSRKRMGHIVTQNVQYAHKRNRGGKVTSDQKTGFYGVYLELGWIATGRPRKAGSDFHTTSTHPGFAAKEQRTLQKSVTTYRGKQFQIGQLREGTKVHGRWAMRNAGKAAEPAAIELYGSELQLLLDVEARK